MSVRPKSTQSATQAEKAPTGRSAATRSHSGKGAVVNGVSVSNGR